jgi:hypothetical protein
MNTNGLAKHYHCLRLEERLPLLLAANLRGDDEEANRLSETAPRLVYRVPDDYPFCNAFRALGYQHLADVLAEATDYLLALSCFTHARDPALAEQVYGLARLNAYRLLTSLDGWRIFCEEMRVDPAACLGEGSRGATLQTVAGLATHHAFTPEEADAWLSALAGAKAPAGVVVEARPSRAADVAKALRDDLRREVGHWE